jgi:hypothetical protein
MGLESGTYIDDFVVTNPVVSDLGKTLADHIWLLKSVLQNTFPNLDGAVTGSPAELNVLDGVTPGTSVASKALVLDASSNLAGSLNNLTALGTITANAFVGNLTGDVTGDVSSTTVTDGTATLTGGVLTGATLTSPVINGSLSGTAFLDDDTFAGDSAVAVASQQSIKAYVDTLVAAQKGKVRQIKIATTSSSLAMTAVMQTVLSVTLTGVESGSTIVLFAVGRGVFGAGLYPYISQQITNNGGTSLQAQADVSTGYETNNYQVVSIAHSASPGTGSVTMLLRASAKYSTATWQSGILVGIEFTP